MLYLQVDMKASDDLSIGDVGRRFDLPTHVLRHWEDVGLLHPRRNASGYRAYVESDLVRVAVIVRSRAAGLSLETIRRMIEGGPRARHDALVEHLAGIDTKIHELNVARAMTQHAFECQSHDVVNCPDFRRFVDDIVGGAD